MLFHTILMTIIAVLQLLTAANNFLQVDGKVGFGPGEQDWGYVTVNPGSHMFWWLFYTTAENVTDVHDKPLVLFLPGGPGTSSSGTVNFEYIGPLDLNLNPRNNSWVKNYNLLFIDNPIGAGFSYTENDSGFSTNNSQIASNLFKCITVFLKEFPKFENVPTYVIGESYGGKMSAEFTLLWAKSQKAGYIKSNLRGIVLGGASITTIDAALSRAPFLFQTGMIDTEGFKKIDKAANNVKFAADNGEWSTATRLFMNNLTYVMAEETANVVIFNIAYKVLFTPFYQKSPVDRQVNKAILVKLMNNEVRKALGINVLWGHQEDKVKPANEAEFLKPVIDIVEQLLNETDLKVFVYGAQLDLVIPVASTLHWVENLKWRNASKWHEATRHPLVIDNIVEGYVKGYDKFRMYWINRVGHLALLDNPAAIDVVLEHITAENNSNGSQ